MVKDKTCKREINDLIEHIKASGKMLDYLEWSKVSENGKAVKATTYHSTKNALSSECKEVCVSFVNGRVLILLVL